MRIVTYQQTGPAVVSMFCSEIQRQTGALRDYKGVLNLNNKHFWYRLCQKLHNSSV